MSESDGLSEKDLVLPTVADSDESVRRFENELDTDAVFLFESESVAEKRAEMDWVRDCIVAVSERWAEFEKVREARAESLRVIVNVRERSGVNVEFDQVLAAAASPLSSIDDIATAAKTTASASVPRRALNIVKDGCAFVCVLLLLGFLCACVRVCVCAWLWVSLLSQ